MRFAAAVLTVCFTSVAALVSARDVQIDGADLAIKYTGFNAGYRSDLVKAQGSNVGGTASFKFKGTKLQYLAPKFAFEFQTQVTIDGKSTVVDLQDKTAETNSISVVFTSDILQDGEHTVVLAPTLSGPKWTVVDSFIYTTSDPILPASDQTILVKRDEGNSNAQKGIRSVKTTLIVALSISVSAIVLVLIGLLFCIRRVRGVQEREWKAADQRRLANESGHYELSYTKPYAEEPLPDQKN